MLAVDDIVLSTNFEVLFSNYLDSCVVLHKLMVAPVDVVVEGGLL